MTAIATKGRDSYIPTLPETSTYQVIDFLYQPTPVDVSDALVYLWAGSTAEQAKDGYQQQARILAAILDRYVNPFVVVTAMEACEKIHQLQSGHCLVDIYGCANIESLRDFHLDAEQQILAEAVRNLGGTR